MNATATNSDNLKAQGADALGIKADEILSASPGPNGLRVTTTDGVKYVVVDPATPDGAGASGLMLEVHPLAGKRAEPLPPTGLPIFEPVEVADITEPTIERIEIDAKPAKIVDDIAPPTAAPAASRKPNKTRINKLAKLKRPVLDGLANDLGLVAKDYSSIKDIAVAIEAEEAKE